MASTKSTIAFFGATGDCAGYCLAAALKNGHSCIALVRSSEKLQKSLAQKGISGDILSQLKIVKGNVRDEATVLEALTINGTPVDKVISGIGSLPSLQMSLQTPVSLRDPGICADAAEILIKALRNLQTTTKPFLAAVSTTGIEPAGKPRDVPFAYIWLYKWLLHVPHVDKEKMETTFRNAAAEPSATRPIRGFVAVKPTLLMDGPAIGQDKIRAGDEDQPAIGYTIRRQDVGEWMYANLIAKEPQTSFLGKGVCLTS